VTLGQLHTFVTVARLGSVKAAAEALGVSEPAVSGAVAALRRDLGDELFIRAGGGIVLTPGGRELSAAGAELLGLADQARRRVREAQGEATLLRIVATPMVAEHVAARLLEAFTRRTPHIEVSLGVEEPEAFRDLLADRRADAVLGPLPPGEPSGLESVSFLRYRVAVVVAASHRLAGRRGMTTAMLAGEPWLTGPGGTAIPPPRGAQVIAFPSQAAVLEALEAGEGVGAMLLHTIREPIARGALVLLDVGVSSDRLWHVTTLRSDRRPPAAWSLWRFATSPEAMQAILARERGVPVGRFRRSKNITLWSQ
jgi:DNA-binding transcriptional LysR family regulator